MEPRTCIVRNGRNRGTSSNTRRLGLCAVCTVVCSFVGWSESHMIYSSKQFRLLWRDCPGKIAKCSRRTNYAGKMFRRSVSIRWCTFPSNAKVFCSTETKGFLSIHTVIECSQSDKRLFRMTRILLLARESIRLPKRTFAWHNERFWNVNSSRVCCFWLFAWSTLGKASLQWSESV